MYNEQPKHGIEYVYDALTTETNVALDMSGTSLGGGESPVRFRFGLKLMVRMFYNDDTQCN